jgi:hypothetical protein
LLCLLAELWLPRYPLATTTPDSKQASSMAQSLHSSIIPLLVSCKGLQAIGVNGGPAEQQKTPPSPSAVIPFRRDPGFIEQGNILDQIHHKCGKPGSRTALVGLGGVG